MSRSDDPGRDLLPGNLGPPDGRSYGGPGQEGLEGRTRPRRRETGDLRHGRYSRGLNHTWLGILALACGLVLLAIQAYAYCAEGLLSTGLAGGGGGLILLGVVCFFYRAEDPSNPVASPAEPTAAEYDAYVDGLEAGAAEPQDGPPPAGR